MDQEFFKVPGNVGPVRKAAVRHLRKYFYEVSDLSFTSTVGLLFDKSDKCFHYLSPVEFYKRDM